MSTKTTFKRVALVTVAALGFGVLATVPSQATINADTFVLSAATATQTTAETSTATSATIKLSWLGAANDSASVTASLVSAPAGGTALPYLALSETTSANIDTSTAGISAVGYTKEPNRAAVVWAGAASASATFKVYLGTDSLTAPAKVGTYVVKLTPASVGASGALQASVAQTLTITVTAAAALDTVATSGTSFLRAAEESQTVTSDAVVTATMAIPTSNVGVNPIANIAVALKNAAGTSLGTAANPGESFTAVITGPGTLGSGAWDSTTNLNANARGRAITVKLGDAVSVFQDGSSGVATITISTALGVVIGTEKVTFFGAAATVVAKSQATVLNPNAANNGDGTDVTTRPIKVVVKDAAGTSVSNATLYVTSETKTIVSDSYATTGMCDYDSTESAYFCKLNALAAGKTNITVGTKSSATATTGIDAAKVEVRVGTTTAASVKVTTDKASYAPGEKATITVQLLDADGNVTADGIYTNIFATGGITSDFVLGTGSDTLTATGVSTKLSSAAIAGKITYTVYMPQNTGDITFTYKTAGTAVTGTAPSALSGLAVANQAVTSTVKVSVSNPGVDAAAAAAEEATAAANDATDAALSAAEAAEAATAMAQEAVDAVAELSASVTKLISALRAQITTLTNLVVKIQKKVRA
jgi:hypothetical protein